MDRNFSVRPEISKIIKELRAGDLTSGLVYGIWILAGGTDGFPIPPNGGVYRPENGGVPQQIDHPKHGGRITLRMSESNQCPANQTQINVREIYQNLPSVEINRCDVTGPFKAKIEPWATAKAKHIYHATDFGLSPLKYGMTVDELDKIQVQGLDDYVRKQQNIYFSYFLVKQADKQVDQNYYLFFYREAPIDLHFTLAIS